MAHGKLASSPAEPRQPRAIIDKIILVRFGALATAELAAGLVVQQEAAATGAAVGLVQQAALVCVFGLAAT